MGEYARTWEVPSPSKIPIRRSQQQIGVHALRRCLDSPIGQALHSSELHRQRGEVLHAKAAIIHFRKWSILNCSPKVEGARSLAFQASLQSVDALGPPGARFM